MAQFLENVSPNKTVEAKFRFFGAFRLQPKPFSDFVDHDTRFNLDMCSRNLNVCLDKANIFRLFLSLFPRNQTVFPSIRGRPSGRALDK